MLPGFSFALSEDLGLLGRSSFLNNNARPCTPARFITAQRWRSGVLQARFSFAGVDWKGKGDRDRTAPGFPVKTSGGKKGDKRQKKKKENIEDSTYWGKGSGFLFTEKKDKYIHHGGKYSIQGCSFFLRQPSSSYDWSDYLTKSLKQAWKHCKIKCGDFLGWIMLISFWSAVG